jgi:hypothetical protein
MLQMPFISSFVPRFTRVRVVDFKQVGSITYLVCDCGHFTRTGMPCRHLWHIKAKYWNEDSPRVIDIHPMWHSAYKAYAFATAENGTKLPPSTAVESLLWRSKNTSRDLLYCHIFQFLTNIFLMSVIQTLASCSRRIGV